MNEGMFEEGDELALFDSGKEFPRLVTVVSVSDRAALLSNGNKIRHDGTVPSGDYRAELWHDEKHLPGGLLSGTCCFGGSITATERGVVVEITIESQTWVALRELHRWYGLRLHYTVPLSEHEAETIVADGLRRRIQDGPLRMVQGEHNSLPDPTWFEVGRAVLELVWGFGCGPDEGATPEGQEDMLKKAGRLVAAGQFVRACRLAVAYARKREPEHEHHYQLIEEILDRSDDERCAERFPE